MAQELSFAGITPEQEARLAGVWSRVNSDIGALPTLEEAQAALMNCSQPMYAGVSGSGADGRNLFPSMELARGELSVFRAEGRLVFATRSLLRAGLWRINARSASAAYGILVRYDFEQGWDGDHWQDLPAGAPPGEILSFDIAQEGRTYRLAFVEDAVLGRGTLVKCDG